jgi:peptide/nickel transport system permease protein
MGFACWIPGVGHWRQGRRGQAAILFAIFALYGALAIWKGSEMASSLSHAAKQAGGSTAPFTERHIDFLVATLFVAAMFAWLILYSGFSYRRAVRNADKPKEQSQGHWAIVWRQFKKNRLAVFGAGVIILLYMVAFLAPLLAPYDPTEQGHRVKERLLDPSSTHLVGTDRFARDVFSRIIYGSRISLLVGFLAVGIAVTIGTAYGAVAGYLSGRSKWIEGTMMRFVDIMLSIPTLILIITIIAVWRTQSIWMIITVIGVTSWMGVARLVRGEFLVLKELDFFQAARALGAGPMRLIFRHLLPNAMTPIIISATLRVGSTILLEAGLSFLGLGVQPPTPSWGNIVFENKSEIFTSWWIPMSAGLAISITVVGYNLLGDGLRDSLDPRLRQ